jgi:hypothetical protein
MSVQGGINIQGTIQGISEGGYVQIGPQTIPASLASPVTFLVSVLITTTTIAVPPGATGVYIIPPATNVNTVNITDSSGNVIINIGLTQPNALALGGTTTNLYMKASATTVVEVKFI